MYEVRASIPMIAASESIRGQVLSVRRRALEKSPRPLTAIEAPKPCAEGTNVDLVRAAGPYAGQGWKALLAHRADDECRISRY